MTGKEIEFKFRVADEEALDAFARALGQDRREVAPRRQRNTFFDSADGRLRAAGLALRLRVEDGRGILTIKGKGIPRSQDGVLVERFEAECTVAASDVQAILDGGLSPLRCLEGNEEPSVAGGLVALHAALADAPLVCLGGFDNERVRLPGVELGAGEDAPIVFELDRTSFPGGRVDCEIEAEVEAEADHARIGQRIYALLDEAGIEWTPSVSKLARFLEILER